VPIDHSVFFSKPIINLQFNPGGRVAYFKTTEKGFGIFTFRPRSGEESESVQLQELAKEESAGNHTLLDALHLQATDPHAPAQEYGELKLCVRTYMALTATLLGLQSDLYKKLFTIWKILDSKIVQERCLFFCPLLCRKIQWAILTDGHEFFSTHLSPDNFKNGPPPYPESSINAIHNIIKFQIPIGRGNLPEKWKPTQEQQNLKRCPPMLDFTNTYSS